MTARPFSVVARAAALAGLIAAVAVLPACDRATPESPAAAGHGEAPRVIFERAVPGFAFTDQDGRPFGSKDLDGKVWVADMIFLRCNGICPEMTNGMRQLQDATRDLADVHLVSFTVDPEQDTVEQLAAYAQQHGAEPSRWHFLRGTIAATKALIAGFAISDAEEPLNHSPRFVLVDRKGNARAVYDGREEGERRLLIEDLRRLAAGGEL